MKENVLNSKGVWLITYNDNFKIVVDLANMLFDSYDWYTLGELNSELTRDTLDQLLTNVKSIKKIK